MSDASQAQTLREYRRMEAIRKQYSNDESHAKARMQRQQIDKLKLDNSRLKQDLALETRQAKLANNMSASAQISKLQDQSELYTRKKLAEGKKIAELKRQKETLTADLLEQQKKMGGPNGWYKAAEANDKHVHRQIQIYESRLDKALVKYNEAAAYNTQLNRTIGNLRRERVSMDAIKSKLERELGAQKKKMADIIAEMNAADEERDKAQAEMVQLKANADNQQARFDESWSEIGQLIEKDQQSKDSSMQQETENLTGEVDPVYEEESRLRNQVLKGYENIKENKANIHHAMEKVQSYEEAFAKIQKATGITDIDELVHTFTGAEDQNFILFNYVNDLSNDIERLEESCASLREETKKYQEGGAKGSVRTKKVIVANMAATLNSTDTKAKSLEERQKSAEVATSALKSGILQLFEKVLAGAESQMKESLLNAGVTEGNMMVFLGMIEDRVTHLLQMYQKEQSDDTKEWDGQFESDDNAADDNESNDPQEPTDAADGEADSLPDAEATDGAVADSQQPDVAEPAPGAAEPQEAAAGGEAQAEDDQAGG